MRFAYEIQKSIKIQSLGGFLPSLSPFLLPLSDSGRASILSQFNLVFSFNVKMDEAEVLAVWYLARKANKKCNRKLWVHPINQGRGEKGAYTLLYKELMDDCTKFFNYFRMTPSSFDELLEKVRSSIQMQDTHLRKSISPQERLCLTLR